jgi:soluble lytic murein transglycosylase-like protein
MAADIYASTGSDGVERWSTQPLNASYRVAFTLPNKAALSDPMASMPSTPRRGQSQAAAAQLAQRRESLYPLIEQTARRFEVDVALVMALVEVESGFNTAAVSPKGARGLMQLMPTTARLYGLRDAQELHQPARNLEIGVRHLKDLLAAHGNQPALALASYNAGQGAVSRHGQRIPRYTETMLYVPAVLAKAARFSSEMAQPASPTIAKAL